VEVSEDIVTFYFQLTPTVSVSDLLCLRCENKEDQLGTNIYLDNGKVAVSINGNAPRLHTFDIQTFSVGSTYDIAVSYVKSDYALELYVNSERKQILYYTRAERLSMEPGMFGCLQLDSVSDKVFSGQIGNFHSKAESPTYRPMNAVCSSIICPSPAKKVKADAKSIDCPGPVCLESDETLCCDHLPKCNPAFTCTQANQYRHNAEDIYCQGLQVGDTCEDTPQDHCCVPEGLCTTYTCPPDRVHYLEAATIYCEEDACTDADLDLCCQPVARCSSYSCPSGMALRENNRDTLCTGSDGAPG
jgi:hypothetical protein